MFILQSQMRLSREYSFWLIAYTLAIVLLGSNLPTPLYVVYQQRWHFSSGILTVIFAVYILGLLASLLFAGRLSDRIGRRRVLLPAIGLAIGSSALFTVAQGVLWLITARFLQGLATGMFTSVATAVLTELEPQANHQHASLVASAATAVGLAGAPLLAGILVQYAPWPTVLVYLVHLALIVPALFGIWWMPEISSPSTHALAHKKPLRRSPLFAIPAGIRSAFYLASATFSLSWIVTALFLALGSSFAISLLHVHNQALNGAIISLFFCVSAGTQLFWRTMSPQLSMRIGLYLIAVGMLVLVFSLLLQSVFIFLVGVICAGLGQGLSFKSCLARVNSMAPSTQRGETVAAFFSIAYLAAGVLIPIVGFVVGYVGLYYAVLLLVTVVDLLAIILDFLLSLG